MTCFPAWRALWRGSQCRVLPFVVAACFVACNLACLSSSARCFVASSRHPLVSPPPLQLMGGQMKNSPGPVGMRSGDARAVRTGHGKGVVPWSASQPWSSC